MFHPRPKALSSIREDRLAARQELKAITNVLDYAGVNLDSIFPSDPLLPLDPSCERRTSCSVNGQTWSYIYNLETMETRWDCPTPRNTKHVRLVLSPDEGSPLYSGYQFLTYNNAAAALNRDELPLYCTDIVLTHMQHERSESDQKAQVECILRPRHQLHARPS